MKGYVGIILALCLLLGGCGASAGDTAAYETAAVPQTTAAAMTETVTEAAPRWEDAVCVTLDEMGFSADGSGVYLIEEVLEDSGGGELSRGVSLYIDKPGVYVLSGQSDAARVVVDLGEGARHDPDAVVTLVLEGLSIRSQGAPAILFKNVYECGDPTLTGETVDTSAAGANIYIADGSENFITSACEGQSEYETAVWSEMSMNIGGSGGLFIDSGGEGLGTALHLTVGGGEIGIVSGNDGINTNYDGASVTTINGGRLSITVSGATGEGDGIDSNGWLVVNGGTVIAAACEGSPDGGLDADMGIYLNGGTVIATGNMTDRITGGVRNYAVLQFAEKQSGGSTYTLMNSDGKPVLNTTPVNDFTCLVLAGDGLAAGEYTLWRGETQLAGAAGMEMPEGAEPPEMPEDMIPPEGEMPPEASQGEQPPEAPDGALPPENMEFPGGGFGQFEQFAPETSERFTIEKGGNYFSYVADVME